MPTFNMTQEVTITQEVTCEVEFEVYCSCGAHLCNQSTGDNTKGRGYPFVTVEPCSKCLDEKYVEGIATGRTEAIEAQES